MTTKNEESWKSEFRARFTASKLGIVNVPSFIKHEVEPREIEDFIHAELHALRERLEQKIEGMKYIFERDKEDYLPEVYKHLKSKNEAFTHAAAIIRANDT